ncbi:unnamed protein product [Rotaria sp. Silwood1]|nr:unnamed protein product [Rotaria sp. Silwood1]CAF1682608.1 unnamed protein product [Rotaria sp. Silwood1]CAF3873914.1 unnamed protein product [Rotaria sp. Silwood1]CAF3950450.1 unnamed protein product [Rotaria sp. Silwood1]CAF4969835.1 unnamed protein product [Rotaria sp. Silwood1]
MMFTDEKIFNRNGYLKSKNDVIWANSKSEADVDNGIYAKEKFPVLFMVARGATWNGLTTPYFFETDEHLNGEMYSRKLLSFYKVEGDRLFGDQNWCLQQDGAISHTNRWPPNSPELNPLDYSIWDSINKNIDYEKVQTKDDLEKEIMKSWKSIDMDYVRQVIGAFLRRVYSVAKHNDGLIIDEQSRYL